MLGYGGSRGAAKSFGIDSIAIARRLRYERTKCAIFRRTSDLVRESHSDKIFEHWPELVKFWRASDREILFPNHSKIAFRYAETAADVKAHIGKEYMDVFVDQAEEFSEDELNVLRSLARVSGRRRALARFVLAFNPGNVGAPYLERVFIKRNYTVEERAAAKKSGVEVEQDYQYVQAYGWDNCEWGRSELESDGVTEEDYYRKWTEDERFQFFISRTAYGRYLNGLAPALRVGWLLGSFEKYAGQYFDCWNPSAHVKHLPPLSYGAIWLGIDWAFVHDAACLWLTQPAVKLTSVYREYVESGRSPRALAQEIIDKTPEDERPRVRQIFLSHEAFGRRDERDTIAAQMGQVFRQAGMPWPIRASRDTGDRYGRYGGPALIYDMLKAGELIISPTARRLIAAIPLVSRDEQEPEKIVSFAGDDPVDALIYGTKDRLGATAMPAEMKLREEADAIADPVSRRYFLIRRWMEGSPAAAVTQAIPSEWGGTL